MTRGARRGVRRGVTRGVRKKGARGVRRGLPGARMSPGNPPPRKRGSLCVATREGGGVRYGANGGNRANRANPPPSDLAPPRQVTFRVNYGVRRLTGLTGGGGGAA